MIRQLASTSADLFGCLVLAPRELLEEKLLDLESLPLSRSLSSLTPDVNGGDHRCTARKYICSLRHNSLEALGFGDARLAAFITLYTHTTQQLIKHNSTNHLRNRHSQGIRGAVTGVTRLLRDIDNASHF